MVQTLAESGCAGSTSASEQDPPMRLFFSLPLPPEPRELAARALRSLPDRLSLGDPLQLHVTLAFLGEQPDAAAALAAGEEAFAGARSFTASLGAIGAFPSPTRPRVIWLGLAEGGREVA
jgi:2'-5' RNA ligase